ncbi:MAG: hypothetical protein V3S69_02055 [Dehalococcoidales bacterium]
MSAEPVGELSLDGSLRHTSGILPMVALAHQEGLGLKDTETFICLQVSKGCYIAHAGA